jgi:Universal stress protein UspA and related nucleotide-binding proteins
VTYADENPVDLIVMATRGMTRVRRFFVGSVTNYVVHHSKVPVLAIPVE